MSSIRSQICHKSLGIYSGGLLARSFKISHMYMELADNKKQESVELSHEHKDN